MIPKTTELTLMTYAEKMNKSINRTLGFLWKIYQYRVIDCSILLTQIFVVISSTITKFKVFFYLEKQREPVSDFILQRILVSEQWASRNVSTKFFLTILGNFWSIYCQSNTSGSDLFNISSRVFVFYYILNMEITSQSLSNFCVELRATGKSLYEVW